MNSKGLLVILLTVFITLQGKTQEVEVASKVNFSYYVDPASKEQVPTVEFKVIVRNKTEKAIPDLRVSNRSKYLNFFINDTNANPVSLYNGTELKNSDKTIGPGESGEYKITWTLSEESGIIEYYGSEFTVQWQYMQHYSKVLFVDLKSKTVKIQQ